jgi:hypothetical protein
MKLNEFLEDIGKEINEEKEDPHIGWDNYPEGWDKESLKKYAKSLTGYTPGEDRFFEYCVNKLGDEEEIDDPERFCAAIKDEYLGREDWRGTDED